MEQKFFLFLVIFSVSFTSFVSGIRINEVELNPSGDDKGNEWVELYSKENIDLNEYKIVNGDGNEILLNSSFSEFLIINLGKQWLDNSNEKVLLYNNDELIDETTMLSDSKNNDLAWSFCNAWEFIASTKEKENSCEEETIEETDGLSENQIKESEEEKQEPDKESNIVKENEDIEEQKVVRQEKITSSVIRLVPKIKENEDSKIYKSKNWYIKQYAIYAYAAFITILLILVITKRRIERV